MFYLEKVIKHWHEVEKGEKKSHTVWKVCKVVKSGTPLSVLDPIFDIDLYTSMWHFENCDERFELHVRRLNKQIQRILRYLKREI